MTLTEDKFEYILFAGGEVGDPLLVEPEKTALSLWQETTTAVDKNTSNIVGIEYGFMWLIFIFL